MCPYCKAPKDCVTKQGFFYKKRGRKKNIQRFKCGACFKYFSLQTLKHSYWQKKPHLNQKLFSLLSSGLSQRRCAQLLGVHQKTVARKILRLGSYLAKKNDQDRKKGLPIRELIFDEMETFEHTKCKPLSIAIAVEKNSRRILSVKVAKMPAKGHLAKISRKKYGFRRDNRAKALTLMMQEIKKTNPRLTLIRSDQCPRYPALVKTHFPGVRHETFKGRRGCVTGQGELKEGGFDPLFSLNHSCAMLRDNLKRLSRRTWCTTKRMERLQNLLDIYVSFHNARLKQRRKMPRISSRAAIM